VAFLNIDLYRLTVSIISSTSTSSSMVSAGDAIGNQVMTTRFEPMATVGASMTLTLLPDANAISVADGS
jgi:hypothetical protein